jgi:hypothetical protein
MRSLPIRLSNEIDDSLNDIARRHGMAKTDVIRLAFSLMTIADREWMKKTVPVLGSCVKAARGWRRLPWWWGFFHEAAK